DHPRIRGEHADLYGSGALEKGSSPHTRGALVGTTVANLDTRIIPAYAGSTTDGPIQLGTGRDHPRIRGEHPRWADPARHRTGSSPHTRGAPARLAEVDAEQRIIPAYAGSTPSPGPGHAESQDHPRIRGEHRGGRRRRCRAQGSSPHTRGAPQPRRLQRVGKRIIPAYAGSTLDDQGL